MFNHLFISSRLKSIENKISYLKEEYRVAQLELTEHESTYESEYLDAIVSDSEHERVKSVQTNHHISALSKTLVKLDTKIDKLMKKREKLLNYS